MEEIFRSICMPSNRSLSFSERSMDSAMTYANLNQDIEFCLSDNSSDPSKKEKYSKNYFERFKYKSNPLLSESENWLNATNLSTGKFIAHMGDDDYVISTTAKSPIIDKPGIIGYRPNIIVWDKKNGITANSSFSITANTAKERILKYFELCKGNNNTLYSFIRRDISLDIFSLCQKYHPVKTGYYDWSIVLAYLSSGLLEVDHSTLYIYDNNNWLGTELDIENRVKNLFIKGNVNERGVHFLKFFIGIDSFILILRRQSPTLRSELEEAAIFTLFSYLQSFSQEYNQKKHLFTSAEQIVINSGNEIRDVQGLLNWVLKVIEVFSEDLVPKYLHFYENCIHRPWGNF